MGRTTVDQEIADVVLKFARENPTWGYDRIQGTLANVGHKVSDQTVGNILKANGIEPAPDRKRQTTWEPFLKAHRDSVAAIDFTTTEIWTLRGLVTTFILVVMNLKTRRIEIAGVTAHPDSAEPHSSPNFQRSMTTAEFFDRTRATSDWVAGEARARYEVDPGFRTTG